MFALDAAHSAGVLTDAEYEAKKAEIVGACAPVAPPAQEINDPAWGFKFNVPAGWQVEKALNAASLTSAVSQDIIFVFPHLSPNVDTLSYDYYSD